MGRPEHPEVVLVKNKFYPKGLKEIDTWTYYQQYKGPILNETRGRDLMLMIMTDVNKPIIVRRGKTTRFARLTNANYDDVVHPRVISIYSTMRAYEDIAVIDIDVDDFGKAKTAVTDVYPVVLKAPIVDHAEIKYTGKEGFHIVCGLKKKMKIDTAKYILERHISGSDLLRKYTMAAKRTKGVPNIDLAPNKFRGAWITLNSLSMWGLRCLHLPPSQVPSFTQDKAKIKVH